MFFNLLSYSTIEEIGALEIAEEEKKERQLSLPPLCLRLPPLSEIGADDDPPVEW